MLHVLLLFQSVKSQESEEELVKLRDKVEVAEKAVKDAEEKMNKFKQLALKAKKESAELKNKVSDFPQG